MPKTLNIIAGLMLAGGCASLPTGPSVLVLPGSSKTYEQFRGDDAICRQTAYFQVGGVTPQAAAVQSGVAGAAIGSAVGAAAGAAIGGGHGAAVGAGTGLAAGSMAGAGAAGSSALDAQQRYDYGYIQCMYAKGHRVPVWGHFTEEGAKPPQQAYPPPPPNQPPPPATYPSR